MQTFDFFYDYSIEILKRDSTEKCTSLNKIYIDDKVILVQQQQNGTCSIANYPTKIFWVTITEINDISKIQFQLQFYTDQYFQMNQYIDCSTWEISNFYSLDQCQAQLSILRQQKSEFISTIIYKLFNEDNSYAGSYIFDTETKIQLEAELLLFQKQLCVDFLKQIYSKRASIRILVEISTSFSKFQDDKVDFLIVDQFQFPSSDNNYCFTINNQQEQVLNELTFENTFGIISIGNEKYSIKSILPLLEYPFFWEGFVFLAGSLVIILIWLFSKIKFSKPRQT